MSIQLSPAGSTVVRNYRHAARIFTDDNMRLSPKYGFMFYVEFDFNPLITNVSNTAAQELGMIVKSVNLPKYTIDTKIRNAYNRKNISQHKINYDAVNISFHDDQADNVRNFWYDYYSFFYRDSDYADATYQGTHKYQSRPSFDWGYTPRPTIGYNNANSNQPYQYIQAVRIYSLYQKNFSEYELINPTISAFKHGEHANGENGSLLEHQMTLQFESVKYYTGYVTENTVGGYIDLHYDRTPSPLAPPGGVDLVDDGRGGYSKATDTITDLAGVNPLYGAVNNMPALTSFSNFSGAFASKIANATALGAAGGVNIGGFTIPSIGGLSAGLTNSTILKQQLTATAAGLAGTAAASLANGVLSGVTRALGTQGTAIVGLAAQAIANPSAALATVQNMAIKWATQQATALVNQGVSYVLYGSDGKGGLVGAIGTGIGQINTALAFNGYSSLSAGISGTIGGFASDLGEVWSNGTNFGVWSTTAQIWQVDNF
ncbi:hypothetical protein UFOVP190_108 [uncultured Caudovirales phage]|uniref:Uncharacterized protein n=1 Tax=uncultured Caudovirales phage TaxID=2100421 RepID=A0A6J7WJQ9_9CAUD|nr:hypothetical protein UFOVP190_108 [uncultured Caudovirales phage]